MTPMLPLSAVAQQFGVTTRTIKMRIKEHGIPVVRPSCRVVLFYEIALTALTEALRPCHSASSSGQTAPIGGSPAPSGGSAYAKALALAMPSRPKNFAPYGRRKLSAKPSTERPEDQPHSPLPASAT